MSLNEERNDHAKISAHGHDYIIGCMPPVPFLTRFFEGTPLAARSEA